MTDLKAFKKRLMIAAFGEEATDRLSRAQCINCHQPAIPNCTTEAGMRELAISGICEKCWDEMFEGEE